MRRFLQLLCCMGLLFFLPRKAAGLTLSDPGCQEGAPFLTTYWQGGNMGQDLACLYRLEGTEDGIPAYRATPGTEPAAGNFVVENLEDNWELAGRIRAVILGGYLSLRPAELMQKANPWLLGHGQEPLCGLQSGEALLATQMTLWNLTGGQTQPCYSGWKDLSTGEWAGFRRKVAQHESLLQQETEYTATNIAGLCAYLESLTPVAGSRKVVSQGCLAEAGYEATQGEQGQWEITVTVPITGPVAAGDRLTLQAQWGTVVQTETVDHEGIYHFSFSGMSSAEPVTVTISGTQQEPGVYAFRNGDTLLAGLVQGAVPVWAQVTLNPDRIVEIVKTTPEGQPLANIQFNIYLAATQDQLQRKEVRLSATPTAEEVTACQTPESLTAIVSTDETGVASYNFTAGGDPDGVYLVVEQYTPATVAAVEPFYITVPGENLVFHLENQVEAMPTLSLASADGKTSFSIGEPQLWQLTAGIPGGLANGKHFSLTVSFPQGVQWEPDSLQIALSTGEGASLLLVEGAHYTLESGAQRFCLQLTPAGMAYAAAAAQGGSLVLSFRALLTQAVGTGKGLVNRAWLDYENAGGISMSVTAESPELTTACLHLTQVDETGAEVTGAQFTIARKAQPGEENSHSLKIQGNTEELVYLSVWPNQALQGEPVEQVTVEPGGAWFSGLAQGEYYLVELRSAPGYRTGEPILITLDGSLTQYTVQARYLLPDTGSVGVWGLTMLGIFAVLAACRLLWVDRKETQAE